MASMLQASTTEFRIVKCFWGRLGSLTAAFVADICGRAEKPRVIHATVYEIEPSLAEYLGQTLRQCANTCEHAGIEFQSDLLRDNFIDDGVRMLRQQMFEPARRFDCAILNPPYKKIAAIPKCD